MIFSLHAQERMIERGIEERNIMEAVTFGEIIRTEENQNGTSVDVYRLGRLHVFLSRETRCVITAWRAEKRNPKTAFRKYRQRCKRAATAWKRKEAEVYG